MHKYSDRPIAVFLIAALVWASTAYAPSAQAQAQDGETHNNVQEMLTAHLKTCGPRYKAINADVEQAGVGDAGYYDVPGYPWIRSDRFLASYVGNFDNELALTTWLSQLRDNEGFARRIELRNLGISEKERATVLNDLRVCAVWLSIDAAFDPETRDDFFEATRVAARENPADSAPPPSERLQNAATPQSNSSPAAGSPVTEWRLQRNSDRPSASEVLAVFADFPRDALGRVGLTDSTWEALAAHYAPIWLIATSSAIDVPGAPKWTNGGLRVDRGAPTTYWQTTYTRVGKQALIQFNYFIWFGGSDRAGAKPSDGLIWRVTLNHAGYPLVYESLRMDGSDHQWFPVKALAVNAQADPSVPQAPLGSGPTGVRVLAANHHVQHVDTQAKYEVTQQKQYALLPYDDLFTLPRPKGGTRSMFDTDGFVVGTHAASNAGMRQLGRHSLAPREPWFFDDPRLFENTFNLPIDVAKRQMSDQP